MTLWSGFNAEVINSTEINGVAPTPDMLFDGFNGDIFPMLIGGFPGLYADVMRARSAHSAYAAQEEDREYETSASKTNLSPLPEIRSMGGERSRKDFP